MTKRPIPTPLPPRSAGSFERFGFAVIADHGISRDLIERAWKETAELFALPEEEKRSYFHPPAGGGQRGYTPFKTEIAKDAKHVDLKEFWHVGRRACRRSPLRGRHARQYLAHPA